MCVPTREECQRKVDVILDVFSRLGVPIAEDKLKGPSQCITFLGIEIDSLAMVCRLPSDKLSALSFLLCLWQDRRKCTKRELLSLIGSLSFACKVIKPGRIFLRRLINLSTKVSKLSHHLDISSSVRADLAMWSCLLKSWNGVEVFQTMPLTSVDLNLYLDPSFHDFGCFFNGSWCSLRWPRDIASHHISVLEMFAVKTKNWV